MCGSWFVLFRPKITRLDFKKSRLTLAVVEDDDQVCILSQTHPCIQKNTVTHTCKLFGCFSDCAGSGAGAHLCIPAGQLQDLQTTVEVCCGESCLLPATSTDHRKDQPQRLHATWLSL